MHQEPPRGPSKLSLDERQAEAISMRTPGVVLGAAGSGKTTVLVERIACLLGSGVPADEILVLAVSQQASDGLCRRLAPRLGTDAPAVVTFEGFALDLVKNHHRKAGLERPPCLLEPEQTVAEALHLLECSRDLLVTYQLRFPHVLVDQFEAATECQARLAVALGGTGLFVAGNDLEGTTPPHNQLPPYLQALIDSPWFHVIRLKGRYSPTFLH